MTWWATPCNASLGNWRAVFLMRYLSSHLLSVWKALVDFKLGQREPPCWVKEWGSSWKLPKDSSWLNTMGRVLGWNCLMGFLFCERGVRTRKCQDGETLPPPSGLLHPVYNLQETCLEITLLSSKRCKDLCERQRKFLRAALLEFFSLLLWPCCILYICGCELRLGYFLASSCQRKNTKNVKQQQPRGL